MLDDLDYALEWNARFWEAPFLWGFAAVGGDLAGKTVLEIGPRRGHMCVWFARRPGARVVGGDLYPLYLKEAQEEGRRHPEAPFALVRMRGEALPFRDASVDLIFTKSVFVFLKKREALAEMLRVLKPGGRVWLVENMRGNPIARAVRVVRARRGLDWPATAGYLTYRDIESYAPLFSSYRHAEFHLASPVFHVLPLPRALLRLYLRCEAALLRALPFFRRVAWLTCIVGRK